jgi:hypothetical protein
MMNPVVKTEISDYVSDEGQFLGSIYSSRKTTVYINKIDADIVYLNYRVWISLIIDNQYFTTKYYSFATLLYDKTI